MGIVLNTGFVVIEAGYGLAANSMALLADAGDIAWVEEPGYGGARTAFALAGYATLVTGGHFVWGDPERRRPLLGIALQGSALGLAGLVAWSRVHDGRHNPSDVLTGAAIGLAMANVAYWRRFDTQGRSRRGRWSETTLTAGPGDAGLGLAWNW